MWSREQSQRVRTQGRAVARWTSQWTTDFGRNSGTYIVYNSHVTYSNSSFALTMVMPTSHFFAFHWLSCLLPIGHLPKPGSVGVRICHYHRIQRRPLFGDFPISSTGCTCFEHNNSGDGDISAITLLILSLSGYNPVNIVTWWLTETRRWEWYSPPVELKLSSSQKVTVRNECGSHRCSHLSDLGSPDIGRGKRKWSQMIGGGTPNGSGVPFPSTEVNTKKGSFWTSLVADRR